MCSKINQCPGGLPVADIVDLADRVGRQIAALGLTDSEDRNTFCTLLGESLTDEFVQAGVVEEPRPYRNRLADIGAAAADAFFAPDALADCAALGPWPGRALERTRLEAGIRAILTSLIALQTTLRIPASTLLDLLVWVQSALAVPAFLGAHPEVASHLGLKRARKRGKRRFIRH